MNAGYIKLWRKTIDSAVWRLPPLEFNVWIWLLMSANWEPHKALLLQEEVVVGAGEIVTSYAHIAEGIAWGGGRGRKRTLPSVGQMRTAVRHLVDLNCIQTLLEPGQGRHQPWLHIKVLHWDQYQGEMGENTTTPPTTSVQPNDNLTTTIKEGKKKNLSIVQIRPLFDRFWAIYPRKEGKGKAEAAFTKALRSATDAEIMAGLEAQLPKMRAKIASGEAQYVPMPATWLNGKRWADEVPIQTTIEDLPPTDFEGWFE